DGRRRTRAGGRTGQPQSKTVGSSGPPQRRAVLAVPDGGGEGVRPAGQGRLRRDIGVGGADISELLGEPVVPALVVLAGGGLGAPGERHDTFSCFFRCDGVGRPRRSRCQWTPWGEIWRALAMRTTEKPAS